MNKENAHLFLPIVKALIEGKTIQMFSSLRQVWDDSPNVKFSLGADRYRIKPEPEKVRSRRFIWRYQSCNGPTPYVGVASDDEGVIDAENLDGFVRWIDTDWQEVELQEGEGK